MSEQKRRKDIFVQGFALFAIFFGAGNLIFPPSLGMAAGDNWAL
ncbi:TPA: branched-chain amino acid transport system II carrier protein, partial [Clostridium botulinum]